MTDLLRRNLAPIADEAWEEIDEHARRILTTYLSGRRIVDFTGPHGWEHAAVNLGRLDVKSDSNDGVSWGIREVLPLVEVRIPFKLNQMELDTISRGATDSNLDPLEEAARKVASFEEGVIYQGEKDAGIKGILQASEHDPVAIPDGLDGVPKAVATAERVLHTAGIEGPYALVLSSARYHALIQEASAAFPPARVIEDMLNTEIMWSPAVDDGLFISKRSGDFELSVGQDLSIGYAAHDKDEVELYFTESLTFRVLEPEACVVLKGK